MKWNYSYFWIIIAYQMNISIVYVHVNERQQQFMLHTYTVQCLYFKLTNEHQQIFAHMVFFMFHGYMILIWYASYLLWRWICEVCNFCYLILNLTVNYVEESPSSLICFFFFLPIIPHWLSFFGISIYFIFSRFCFKIKEQIDQMLMISNLHFGKQTNGKSKNSYMY